MKARGKENSLPILICSALGVKLGLLSVSCLGVNTAAVAAAGECFGVNVEKVNVKAGQ